MMPTHTLFQHHNSGMYFKFPFTLPYTDRKLSSLHENSTLPVTVISEIIYLFLCFVKILLQYLYLQRSTSSCNPTCDSKVKERRTPSPTNIYLWSSGCRAGVLLLPAKVKILINFYFFCKEFPAEIGNSRAIALHYASLKCLKLIFFFVEIKKVRLKYIVHNPHHFHLLNS